MGTGDERRTEMENEAARERGRSERGRRVRDDYRDDELREAVADLRKNARSAYVEVGARRTDVRIADHLRHRHHAASYNGSAYDCAIVLCSAERAAHWREALQADRFWEQAAIIEVRPRERTATLVRKVRAAVAAYLWSVHGPAAV